MMIRTDESRQVVLDKFRETILGLRWDPTGDKIIIKMPMNFSEQARRSKSRTGPPFTIDDFDRVDQLTITKVDLLSQIASTYGTLGLLSPLTIRVKLILQKVVILEVGWKDPIPEPLLTEVKEALKMMILLGEVEFHRTFLGVNWEAGYDIAAYFDGANLAFTAVLYALTPLKHPSLGVPEYSVDKD